MRGVLGRGSRFLADKAFAHAHTLYVLEADAGFGIAYGYVVEGYIGDGLCLRALQDKGCGAHVVALQTVHEEVSDDREVIVVLSLAGVSAGNVEEVFHIAEGAVLYENILDETATVRQEAGLDSVLQAAGRCNREGKNVMSTTYVFSLAKEHTLPRGEMQAANQARLSLNNTSDWFAPSTMTEYFRQLYCRKESFDKKDIKHLLYKPTEICFATAAKEFRLIEDAGVSVIVCWKDSMDLVDQVLHGGPSYILMKKLAQYTVNIYQSDFNKLLDMGVVSEKKEGLFVVEHQQQYDPQLGIACRQ